MECNEKFKDMSNEELFRSYRVTGDIAIKQELVLRYLYIVRSVAMQMRGVYSHFTQLEDIVSEGVLVLMTAIDKFDIEKKIKFESFISKRVRGLVIDIVRKHDWVPRSIRKMAKDIDKATTVLFTQLGRMPTNEEIAMLLHMPLEKYLEELGKTNVMSVVSFELLLEEGSGGKVRQVLNTNPETIPECRLDQMEVEVEIKTGLQKLREKEQLVVSLHYVQELSMKEIATILGVSEPRVSQIHANALRKLRIFMQESR